MTDLLIDAGDDVLELVIVASPEAPPRILRVGARGRAVDIPGGRSAVELLLVNSGHTPAVSRLVDGALSATLRYVSHEQSDEGGTRVTSVTSASAELGVSVLQRFEVPRATGAVRSTVTVHNDGAQTLHVQAVPSLCLGVGIGGGAPEALRLVRAATEWIGESRWRIEELRGTWLPELSLPIHDTAARHAAIFRSSGTWSTSGDLPFGALLADDGAWAWQIEHNGGWRWELGEDRAGVYFAASGPTDPDHQWLLDLGPGESFTTVPATLGTGQDLEGAVAALTAFRRAVRHAHPDDSRVSVVFNDYMNTLMGDPTTEKLLPLIEAASDAGAEIFCVDAGWYDDSGDWWQSVGEWEPSTVRFPRGLDEVLDRIRTRDMVPGLWLEPEVIGIDSPMAERLPMDAFLQRHGERVVENGRFHLDLRHEAARAHLDAVIDRIVGDWGVGYLKLDYNINPGAGTDVDAESAGVGLLEHNRAHLAWLDGVRERYPNLVIENCASGAMRMDFAMTSRLQLQSTSDQQDPLLYPPIAAAAPIAVLPEQAANWAYPQPSMDDEQMAFTLCTAMLGRFYLSGHLAQMTPSQRSFVADAVTAHKTIRGDIATSSAFWPLGIAQYGHGWVALGLEAGRARYLTLWALPGSGRTVEIPLPALRGAGVAPSTLFPRRVAAWATEWDEDRAILTVTRPDDAAAGARTFVLVPPTDRSWVRVDASTSTGAVHGGATGMLYGLADPGVPQRPVIEGALPRTLAQKPPRGAQHPNGDALEVAGEFFDSGGTDLYVYLQDALREWPYEQPSIDEYAELVTGIVRETLSHPRRTSFVWVPFNEGDWIWYGDWDGGEREHFFEAWDTVFRAIREVDPDARIAGPNESRYQPLRVTEFFEHVLAVGTTPTVMSWHELQPSSLEVFRPHLAHYRALERRLGFGPLPIVIDEYANKQDMSDPGRLLAWIALFEEAKVDADLAYWTAAGNLDDHAIGARRVNGGWWLLHWYGLLRGETVATQTPLPDVRDRLRALAARDGDAVTVLAGGGGDDIQLEVSGLGGAAACVRVERASWTGYVGDAVHPPLISDDQVVIVDGVVRLTIPNDDPMSLYRVVVLPGVVGSAAPETRFELRVPVSAARIEGSALAAAKDDPQVFAAPDDRYLPSLSTASFDVAVPAAGRYRLGIFYGTEGERAAVELEVDGVAEQLSLPATLSSRYWRRADVERDLAAGVHVVSLTAARTGVSLAGIELIRDAGPQPLVAIDGRPRDGVRFSGTSARLDEGALSFSIAVRARGRYRIEVDGDDFEGEIDHVGFGMARGAVVTLPQGVSTLALRGSGELRSIMIIPVGEGEQRTFDVGTLPASFGVGALEPGWYLVTLEAANASRWSGHMYNADVISAEVTVTLGGESALVRVPFTYSVDTFEEVSVAMRLMAVTDTMSLVGGETAPVVRRVIVERWLPDHAA